MAVGVELDVELGVFGEEDKDDSSVSGSAFDDTAGVDVAIVVFFESVDLI